MRRFSNASKASLVTPINQVTFLDEHSTYSGMSGIKDDVVDHLTFYDIMDNLSIKNNSSSIYHALHMSACYTRAYVQRCLAEVNPDESDLICLLPQYPRGKRIPHKALKRLPYVIASRHFARKNLIPDLIRIFLPELTSWVGIEALCDVVQCFNRLRFSLSHVLDKLIDLSNTHSDLYAFYSNVTLQNFNIYDARLSWTKLLDPHDCSSEAERLVDCLDTFIELVGASNLMNETSPKQVKMDVMFALRWLPLILFLSAILYESVDCDWRMDKFVNELLRNHFNCFTRRNPIAKIPDDLCHDLHPNFPECYMELLLDAIWNVMNLLMTPFNMVECRVAHHTTIQGLLNPYGYIIRGILCSCGDALIQESGVGSIIPSEGYCFLRDISIDSRNSETPKWVKNTMYPMIIKHSVKVLSEEVVK